MTTQPTPQPTADQPLVTHEDLGVLQHLRIATGPDFEEEDDERVSALLDRLIAAAEADKPALPEGWVLIHEIPRWHDGKGGITFCPGGDFIGRVVDYSSPITPLVTAASLVPEDWHVDEDGEGLPTVWDANELVLWPRLRPPSPDPVFDVLAALVAAAEAERGESR